MYRQFGKRTIDLILAVLGLILLAPVIIVGLLVAWADTRTNPVFIHRRPGLRAQPFALIKLRTMSGQSDSSGRTLSNIERTSAIGRWLRRYSIDELPQLINVILGQLSLVGPRPLEMRYLPHYSPQQARRHEVRPGITGLAQVTGRNSLNWEEKFVLDVEYVDQHSLALDSRILWLTIRRTLSGAGVNASDSSTMDPFA